MTTIPLSDSTRSMETEYHLRKETGNGTCKLSSCSSSEDLPEFEDSCSSFLTESCGETVATLSDFSLTTFNEEENGSNDNKSLWRRFCPLPAVEVEKFESESFEKSKEAETKDDKKPSPGLRRFLEILHSPRAYDLKENKRSVRNWKQRVRNAQLATLVDPVSRQDHHAMLQTLVGLACSRDPNRQANRENWCKLRRDISRRFSGASILLTSSADPYAELLGNLSQMCIWNDTERTWNGPTHSAILERQQVVLAQLRQSGKLFLD